MIVEVEKKWKKKRVQGKRKEQEDRQEEREGESTVPYALHCARYFRVEGKKDFKW